MRRIGLLGGMSWESTVVYYRQINEAVKDRLGGLHSAELVLFSVDFEAIERLQARADWDAAGQLLAEAAQSLQAAGAELLVLCTNTMHKVAPAIEAAVAIPLLHIADATAEAIKREGMTRVGLLGTRFTMEEAFYSDRLRKRHGLDVLLPSASDRDFVHRVIYEELCQGQVSNASRTHYRRIMRTLVDQGAQGIILGCTEIGLLVDGGCASVPLFDTARFHALAAVDAALA